MDKKYENEMIPSFLSSHETLRHIVLVKIT